MKSTRNLAATAALAALAAAPALAAGTVEVRFVEPASYSDIGWHSWDREHHLQTLQAHFQRLADRLPQGQTLRVDVLDVDLAGDLRPHHGHDLRVLRGSADWPRLTLRYELRGAAGTLKSGQQVVADPAYLHEMRGALRYSGALSYEQRLIDRWFADTFEDH